VSAAFHNSGASCPLGRLSKVSALKAAIAERVCNNRKLGRIAVPAHVSVRFAQNIPFGAPV